jgi:hypothetical protein
LSRQCPRPIKRKMRQEKDGLNDRDEDNEPFA